MCLCKGVGLRGAIGGRPAGAAALRSGGAGGAGGAGAASGLVAPVDAQSQRRDAPALAATLLLKGALGLRGRVPQREIFYNAVCHRVVDSIAAAYGLRAAGLHRDLCVGRKQGADILQRRDALFDSLLRIGHCQQKGRVALPHHALDQLFQPLNRQRLGLGTRLALRRNDRYRRNGLPGGSRAFQTTHRLFHSRAVQLAQKDAGKIGFQPGPQKADGDLWRLRPDAQRKRDAGLGAFYHQKTALHKVADGIIHTYKTLVETFIAVCQLLDL